jgi:hypothetical protein
MCSKVVLYYLACKQIAGRVQRAEWYTVACMIVKEDKVKLATTLEEVVEDLFNEVYGM